MKLTWQYIAGFFDGEGCLAPFTSKKSSKKRYWKISITQNDLAVLEAIQDFVGAGTIYNSKWERSSRYQIFRQEEVLGFVKNIYPFVIVKKGKLREHLKRTGFFNADIGRL